MLTEENRIVTGYEEISNFMYKLFTETNKHLNLKSDVIKQSQPLTYIIDILKKHKSFQKTMSAYFHNSKVFSFCNVT